MIKRNLIISFLALPLLAALPSCKKKGCTDPESYTYSSDADEDDGTCKYYYGGRDYGQLDVGATVDLDNEYTVFIDGDNVGRSLMYFPNGLSCGNPDAVGKVILYGSHTVTAVGNGGTEVREGSVFLDRQDCKIVLIEELPLK
ncbi:MAG: hypothetical protein K0R82_1486 [Flavipsychrobacter sp.]|jgi:hypothetical protein|nr:hypothetical protein [Flavipsychrobacter sp.]